MSSWQNRLLGRQTSVCSTRLTCTSSSYRVSHWDHKQVYVVQDSNFQQSATGTTNKCMQYKTHESSCQPLGPQTSVCSTTRLTCPAVSHWDHKQVHAVQDSHVQLVHLFVELLAEAGHLAADESQVGLGVGQLALQGAVLRLDVLQSLSEAGQLSLLLLVKLVQSFLQTHSIIRIYCRFWSNLFSRSCKHSIKQSIAAPGQTCSVLPANTALKSLLPLLVKPVQSFLQTQH